MKSIDVVGICNALMDVLIEIDEHELKALNIQKGVMHLVDSKRQSDLFDRFFNRSHTIELGGSVLNAVRTLACLGSKTVFAGSIGQDVFGQRILNRMQELNIKARLANHPEESTGTCLILITPDGERTMNTNLGASRLYDESLVPHDDISIAKIFHFSGYQWDTDGQKLAIDHAIDTAKNHSTLVSFDVSDPFCVERHRKDFLKIIEEDADVVFANLQEAAILFQSTPEKAAEYIMNSGAIAVIKLGAKGALVGQASRIVKVDAIPTRVVDTTAAGDMFAAGFLYALHLGRSLEDCGKAATLLAADVIKRVGATVSEGALQQVTTLLS